MPVNQYFFANVPRQVSLAGMAVGSHEGASEGARPAPLPAGPVPERSNGEPAPIETPHGQRLAERAR